MPFTAADQLNLYRSGQDAGSDYGPDASIGGHRLSVVEGRLDFRIDRSDKIAPILIQSIMGQSEGIGYLNATATGKLQYTDPDGNTGSEITLAVGDETIAQGGDVNHGIRARYDLNLAYAGLTAITLRFPFNNVIAHADIPNAYIATGVTTVRAAFLNNDGPSQATDIAIYVDTLGTVAVSDTTQLGATGSGTIETTDSFADWPESGWVRIETSGGTLREIAYYASRTDTVLTITADGRGLLLTSADAGSATDNLYPVPGIYIALQEPDGDGLAEAVADEFTGPSYGSVSPTTGRTAATGITWPFLNPDEPVILWILREIPPNASPSALMENAIRVQWTVNAVTYNQKFGGYYRVENTTDAGYRLYVGHDASPDFTAAPAETSATLPFDHTPSLPVSGTRAYHMVVREMNGYGLESGNIFERVVTLDNTGTNVTGELHDPMNVTAESSANGIVTVLAEYEKLLDADPADRFAIYVSTDGTDPDVAVDTPTLTALSDTIINGPTKLLAATFGPYDYGTDFRCIVRMHRTSDGEESLNETVVQETVTTTAPIIPALRVAFVGGKSALAQPIAFGFTDYWNDPTNTVFTRTLPGETQIWSDTTLCLRAVFKRAANAPTGGDLGRIYIPDDWELVTDTVNGAASALIDVVSTTEFYIAVGGVRRVKFDASAKTITAAQWEIPSEDVTPAPAPASVYGTGALTGLQVYNMGVGRWTTALEVTAAGLVRTPVPITKDDS